MIRIPHSPLVERYLVSAILLDPRLLALPSVGGLEVADVLECRAALVFAAIRNLEAAGHIPTVFAVLERLHTVLIDAADGDRTGHKFHPDIDEIFVLARRHPPTPRAVARLVRIVQRDAAARARLRRQADEPERFEALLVEAMLASVEHLPPGRPEPRQGRRAA